MDFELNKHFQDRWAIKLLWAKCVLSSNGKVANPIQGVHLD